jgi:hypothetical protein
MKFQSEWLDLSDEAFRVKMDWWMADMKRMKFLASTRKEHVQKAVDVVWAWASYHDGERYFYNSKWNTLTGSHQRVFKTATPQHTITIVTKIAKREILTAQENLVKEKIRLVDHWINTMNSTDDFLQGPEDTVQETLLDLYKDAQVKCGHVGKQPWMTIWYGADAKAEELTWSKERTRVAVKGEAAARVGIQASGEYTYEFRSLKVKAKFAAEAGGSASGSFSGSASLTDGITASAEAEVFVGVRMSADVSIEVSDVLEAGASVKAMAGAIASGSAKFSLTKDGLAIGLKGEAFAGFKAEGEGHIVTKWKGREIFRSEATVAFTAGIGASGELSFTAGIGKSEIALKGGLTIGVGSEVGTKVEFSLMNLEIAGVQWMYEDLRQATVPRAERYEILMMDRANLLYAQEVLIKLKALEAAKARELKAHNAIAAL